MRGVPQARYIARGMAARTHQFFAIAFVENLPLKDLGTHYPEARVTAHELFFPTAPDAGIYMYPFGATVFHNVPQPRREQEIARLERAHPGLTTRIVREDYSLIEDAESGVGLTNGNLRVDKLTPARAGVVALTVAQSAAMEYYEQVVDSLFARTGQMVERMEVRGTVPLRTKPLVRFIGEAISNRNEVLSILHLLDKPDATWEDPAMDLIYNDLRTEFDLSDRYSALELKLRSVQEALELVVDVARDRRLLLLEIAVALLILTEIILPLLRIT
ncbi:MAG: RMD1 family protein [Candidatus Binataceae bacterium]